MVRHWKAVVIVGGLVAGTVLSRTGERLGLAIMAIFVVSVVALPLCVR